MESKDTQKKKKTKRRIAERKQQGKGENLMKRELNPATSSSEGRKGEKDPK